MVTIKREKPTTAAIENMYEVIRQVIQEPQAYYSAEELEKLKEDTHNIFLERGKE